METLDQQIDDLVQQAPEDGVTATLIAVIAPLLKQTASQLRHPEYYVLQGEGEGWVMTTLSNRAQPNQEKSVIYAFPTSQDAQQSASRNADQGNALGSFAIAVPVVHILFQLLALQQVDSVIFFETPGVLQQGTEVRCDDFRRRVQGQIAAYQAQIDFTGVRRSPPDIA